jgi:sugar/nucleoside kinase (ribokinase family)
MRRKIIAAGHICLDITPVFPNSDKGFDISEVFVPGKLIHTKQAEVSTGGSVANTGLALKLLGADVLLMGKIGDDAFGAIIQKLLKKYDADGLLVSKDSSTSYSIVLAVPGIDRIFLHNPGSNDTFSDADIRERDLEDAVLFHFGYPPLMKKMYENDGEELIKIFRRMKDLGIATSLDFAAIDPKSEAGHADWKKILKNVLPLVDFFLPSFEELCFMLDREKYDRLSASGSDMTEILSIKDDVKPLSDELLRLGCKVVLIKCGTAGIYYRTAENLVLSGVGSRLRLDTDAWADKEGLQPCFKAEQVLSATGAGDTSIAAFLAAVLKNYAPEKCVALAAAEGACCVTAYDALSGLMTLDELKRKMED